VIGQVDLGDRFINLDVMLGDFALMRSTTSRENSPQRRPTPARIDEDCGLIRIRCRRGSGDARNDALHKPNSHPSHIGVNPLSTVPNFTRQSQAIVSVAYRDAPVFDRNRASLLGWPLRVRLEH
jgi:hypothetical protein